MCENEYYNSDISKEKSKIEFSMILRENSFTNLNLLTSGRCVTGSDLVLS